MGQTRVDLQHLLEDLRDAYPGAIEETILSEVVANALDSGASSLRVLTDASERTVVFVDDGCGMSRRELARFHDLAASGKTRGEGIGFAGVGIKLGLLVADAVRTETRRAGKSASTAWRLSSRHRAPWEWVPPPGWVVERGTAVSLHLRNPLSPLLDAGYIERCLRLHFEPLFDPAFDEILVERYPQGIAFVVNGHVLARPERRPSDRAPILVRLPRRRKPAAVGWLGRMATPLPEDLQGLAVSTLGKVIRRGWDWLGLASASPGLVGGLIEAPGLASALTLNKGDFVRAGRRGITYLAYRKAIQEAVQAQLAAWGESRDRQDSARRRTARPLERDLESVLVDLADEFPALAALVERRPGGQKRLPTGRNALPGLDAAGESLAPQAHEDSDLPAAVEAAGGPSAAPSDVAAPAAPSVAPPEHESTEPPPAARVAEPPPSAGTLSALASAPAGPRRPTRYGLGIDFEERPEAPDLGRLVESTVYVNTAHPAYRRAATSRSEGYHAAIAVGLALAAVAVEPQGAQSFLTTFLARWGEAVSRDRRRRQPPSRGRATRPGESD